MRSPSKLRVNKAAPLQRYGAAKVMGCGSGVDGAVEAAGELFVFFAEGCGETGAELGEEFIGVGDFGFPVGGMDFQQFTKGVGRNVQAVESQGVFGGDVADRSFFCGAAAFDTF